MSFSFFAILYFMPVILSIAWMIIFYIARNKLRRKENGAENGELFIAFDAFFFAGLLVLFL